MRITDLLTERGIELNGRPADKAQTIDQMVALMEKTGVLNDPQTYKKLVLAREEEGTTGIGEGVAIPHAKTPAVSRAGLCAMVVPDGVDYESLDGQPARLIFLIAAPDTDDNIHLDVLGRLSVLLMDDEFRNSLIHASSPKEFLQIIDRAEGDKVEDEREKQQAAPSAAGYRVLAVTACPTGIAHTYMAAESLENTAKEMGISIKVETDGSGGAKNVLTASEIAQCECIIVAADKQVEMARFAGKPVIVTKVANGISKAKELLTEATSGRVPVYRSDEKAAEASSFEGESESFGRKVYKHLMNGVSHMLPFVIGGGILIALAFLFDGANAGTANFGSGNVFSAFLKTVGDLAFGMMFPILAGFIAMSIGDRPAFMVGVIGGLLAKEGVGLGMEAGKLMIYHDGAKTSGFFGALFAGFLAGLIVLLLRKLFDRLPKALEGTKPVLLYPFFGILLIAAVMVFVVNPPLAWFNSWLNWLLNSMGGVSKVILGVVLGGMMSIDFGGPINKAAYVFGTAAIASGQYDIMAAVMIGGMVPPLAIALATTFFRNRFTKKERSTTITNYIMGAAFITEGAIPFAAADPLRVIPPCAIGSAVAGGLSMLFGCGSRAPHGGLFVVGIIDHPLMYLLALAIGAVVGMLLLAVFKKPIREERETASDR